MWKKIFIVLLSLALLGCNHADEGVTPETTAPKTAVSETTAAEDSPDVDNAISEGFASAPFWDLAERDSLAVSDEDIKDVIAKIPSEQYEAYPDIHSVPVSAILHKNGEAISIDPDDERLIRLTNFINNCIYYSKCSYTQSLLPIDFLEKNVTGCDFRLELQYIPYGETVPSPYGTCTAGCDTIVITNYVTLIAHDLPGYAGRSESYPFRAIGVYPLYRGYSWLEWFGF